jgi:hypothetical protein
MDGFVFIHHWFLTQRRGELKWKNLLFFISVSNNSSLLIGKWIHN